MCDWAGHNCNRPRTRHQLRLRVLSFGHHHDSHDNDDDYDNQDYDDDDDDDNQDNDDDDLVQPSQLIPYSSKASHSQLGSQPGSLGPGGRPSPGYFDDDHDFDDLDPVFHDDDDNVKLSSS